MRVETDRMYSIFVGRWSLHGSNKCCLYLLMHLTIGFIHVSCPRIDNKKIPR